MKVMRRSFILFLLMLLNITYSQNETLIDTEELDSSSFNVSDPSTWKPIVGPYKMGSLVTCLEQNDENPYGYKEKFTYGDPTGQSAVCLESPELCQRYQDKDFDPEFGGTGDVCDHEDPLVYDENGNRLVRDVCKFVVMFLPEIDDEKSWAWKCARHEICPLQDPNGFYYDKEGNKVEGEGIMGCLVNEKRVQCCCEGDYCQSKPLYAQYAKYGNPEYYPIDYQLLANIDPGDEYVEYELPDYVNIPDWDCIHRGECDPPTVVATSNDSNIACDGTADFGKELNDCGHCMLRSDPNFDDYGRDCRGVCVSDILESYYLDSCGQCLLFTDPAWDDCVDRTDNETLNDYNETVEHIENEIAEIEMEIDLIENVNGGTEEITEDSLTEQVTVEEDDADEVEHSVSTSLLTPFVKSSPNSKKVDDELIGTTSNKKTKSDDDDDIDTKDANRKDTYTDQIEDDSEADDEYDIARNWLYAKSENDAVNKESTATEASFGKDDVAVLFVIFVIVLLGLGMGFFIGSMLRENQAQMEKVSQCDYV